MSELTETVKRRRGYLDLGLILSMTWILIILIGVLFGNYILNMLGVDAYDYHLEQLDIFGVPEGPFLGATPEHLFGIEPQTGRDIFAMLVVGGKNSLGIAFGSTIISLIFAIILGVAAGFFGGIIDLVISRIIDIMMGFPSLIFMIAISAIIPPQAPRALIITVVIGFFGWASLARIIRGHTLALRNQPYVNASKVQGGSLFWRMRHHIFPNVLAPIIVLTTMSLPSRIATEAALSFLGVGISPPTPSWGRMIGEAVSWLTLTPWYVLTPGIALFLTTLAFNYLGDYLRDILDPTIGKI